MKTFRVPPRALDVERGPGFIHDFILRWLNSGLELCLGKFFFLFFLPCRVTVDGQACSLSPPSGAVRESAPTTPFYDTSGLLFTDSRDLLGLGEPLVSTGTEPFRERWRNQCQRSAVARTPRSWWPTPGKGKGTCPASQSGSVSSCSINRETANMRC